MTHFYLSMLKKIQRHFDAWLILLNVGFLGIFIIYVGSPHIKTPHEMWWGSDFSCGRGHHRVGPPHVGGSLPKIT